MKFSMQEYEKFSSLLQAEKDQQMDRLISEFAKQIATQESQLESSSDPVSERKETQREKLAMVSLKSVRASIGYHLIEQGQSDLEENFCDDIKSVAEDYAWLAYFSGITKQTTLDTLCLFEIIGGLPEKNIKKVLPVKIPIWSNNISITPALFNVLAGIIRYFHQICEDEISSYILERMIEFSAKRNSLEKHRKLILFALLQCGESLPVTGIKICEQNVHLFDEDNEQKSDYLWFYGTLLEISERYQEANLLFEDCWDLRKKQYGDSNLITALAMREYAVTKDQEKLDEGSYRLLCSFIKDLDGGKYGELSQPIEAVLGKTAYIIIISNKVWPFDEDFMYYLKIHRRICEKFSDSVEPLLKLRLNYNEEGRYYFQKYDLIQAEQCFANALNTSPEPDGVPETISDAQIMSNLLLVYYLENDVEKAYSLAQDLFDIIEQDDNYSALPKKDVLRVWGIFAGMESQQLAELDPKEIADWQKILNTLSTEILAAPADLKDWIRPAVACITTCITLLFSNDSLDRECALLCHKALLSIQGKTAHFKLDFVQLAGFFYSMFLLESSLGLPCQEQYLNQCLELIPNDALPFQMKAAFFQVAAAHFFQCGQLSRMEKYLKSALNEMTSVWQSYVRYLSDERLIQILSPTQNLFSLCYSLTRTDKEEGCERVLQFKHLASLAGKERNRILRSGAMDENLLHQIQNMQNHVAALASRALFRDENSEEEERAWDNLRQLEAEFSARFPENLTFTEITLEKVKKAIPNNSVVVEYFFAAVPSVEAQKHDLQLDPCLDIYIICKRNEQCAFFRETVPNGGSIVKTAEKFIDTLQAESGDNASISQVMSKETLRSSLFHQLLLPVLPYLEGMQAIYIAPDGILVNLPFELLCDHDEWVKDNQELIKIECARDFLYDNSDSKPALGHLLLGNPKYSVHDREFDVEQNGNSDSKQDRAVFGEAEPLPFTQLEIERIGRRTASKFYGGLEATKARFLSTKGFRTIHVATHGYFDLKEETDALFSSSLLFSGSNDWLHTGIFDQKYDNGTVTADEISRMDLRSTELVVLSSCLTGMNEVFINKGFYGMISAFSAAGVHYVISHLWKADDFATAVLMDAFYYFYAQLNLSPPVALRKAKSFLKKVTIGQLRRDRWFADGEKLELTEDLRKAFEHLKEQNDQICPFQNEIYWGGFVCYKCN